MRSTTKNILYGLLLLLLIALPAWPQEEEETEVDINADIAVYGNYVDEDSSKAEEYGDVPEGFLINGFLADVRWKEGRYMKIRGKNVGLNSGQYGLDYGLSGEYKLFVDYKKIPHLFSRSGETIWSETSPGIWELPDPVQASIEALNPYPPVSTDPLYAAALTAQRQYVSDWLDTAHAQSLGLIRNRTTAGFKYSPSTTWKYGVEYYQEIRDGYRPFGTSFGFSWVTELPEHIDYNTERVRAGVEYAKDGKSFAVSYDFMNFNNEVETMRWDNPLRFTDRTYSSAYSPGDGTSLAQAQMPADNKSNMLTFTGAAKVGSGRFTGMFSWNNWTNEVDLLPFTVNTSIEPIPLPSNTFNGDQTNLTLNLRYTVPIGEKGDFTASYRLFDNQNDNDSFNIGEYVRFDQVMEELHRFDCTATGCTEISNPPTPLFAFKTNTFDADFGWKLTDDVNWHVAYQFHSWDREHRDAEKVDTNQFKTTLDARMSDTLTLRFAYIYASQRFDELEYDNPTYLPTAVPLIRYDIANMNRNLFRFMADFAAGEKGYLGFNFSYQKRDYTDTLFGLQAVDEWTAGADYSYATTETTSLNLWYEHSEWTSDQMGRQSGSAPSISPGDDWFVTVEDDNDAFGIGYNAGFSEGKGTWDTSFTYARGNGLVDITAGSTIRPTGAVGIENADDTDLYTFKTAFYYKAFKNAKLGLGYWFDRYEIDDFAEDTTATDLIFVPGPTGAPTLGGSILLNAIQPGYTYHTGWVGLVYSW